MGGYFQESLDNECFTCQLYSEPRWYTEGKKFYIHKTVAIKRCSLWFIYRSGKVPIRAYSWGPLATVPRSMVDLWSTITPGQWWSRLFGKMFLDWCCTCFLTPLCQCACLPALPISQPHIGESFRKMHALRLEVFNYETLQISFLYLWHSELKLYRKPQVLYVVNTSRHGINPVYIYYFIRKFLSFKL